MNDMHLSHCLFFLTRRLIIFFRWNCFVLYPLYQIQVHPELFTIDGSYLILTSKNLKFPSIVLLFLFALDKKDLLSPMDGEDLQYIWVVETEFEMNKFKFVKVYWPYILHRSSWGMDSQGQGFGFVWCSSGCGLFPQVADRCLCSIWM